MDRSKWHTYAAVYTQMLKRPVSSYCERGSLSLSSSVSHKEEENRAGNWR